MTIGIEADIGAPDGATWWYRDGKATMGPVSTAELRRLADGPLGPETLVWRKTFGEHWKRLDSMLGGPGIDAPPSIDHGRWTDSFARFEADPKKGQLSWLGILGPFAYLYLGMWRRALVIASVGLAFSVLFALADSGHQGRTHLIPNLVILSFCVRNVKRDYYHFKVLGEPMWPRVRALRSGYACGGLALSMFIALVFVRATDPVDNLMADVAGVWQSDGASVVIDVAGQTKAITYGGSSHLVRLTSVDDDAGVIVFADIRHPKTLITLQKHWSEDHATYSVDFLVDDRLMANLLYVRPV